MSIEVSGLTQGYIKSAARIEVPEVEIGENGPQRDRCWMVVDANGKFMLSDRYPKMRLIRPFVEDNNLILSGDGVKDQLAVPFNDNGKTVVVEMFEHALHKAIDDGDGPAKWIARFLNVDNGCRLVHMPANYERRDSKGLAKLNFADSWAMTLGNDASLKVLNLAIQETGKFEKDEIRRDRFGHNVWINGTPFEEDTFAEISINGQTFTVAKPIVRCSRILNKRNDLVPGQLPIKQREPLATLAKFRRTIDGDVIFGQKMAHVFNPEEGPRVIHVGDKVEVRKTKTRPEFA